MRNSILNRRFKYTYHFGCLILIGINVLMFFIQRFYPRVTYALALIPYSIIYEHSYWQFFTYMFVHGSVQHLISNMLGLLIFSLLLEKAIGTREYILYYLLSGTLAGVASFIVYWITGSYFSVLLGASGALYAVMFLFACAFPRSRLFVFGILPIRAPVLVLIYFCIEFFSQFRSDGVAHTTHLFGLLFGYLYIRIRMRISPLRALFGLGRPNNRGSANP